MIFFELLAVALGVAAVVYLVYALVKPRRLHLGIIAVFVRRPHRQGGREAVIFFELLAAALGVAAVVYLVYALVKPERF